MAFNILILILVGLVVFFHYVQGFFSATLSAMITVIAAAMAISYYEPVVNTMLKGKMADDAHGLVLCVIFAITYLLLRTLFDAFIPGNVQTPNVVDKAGAVLMGLVAAVFSVGIFAIAVQTLPFDPEMSYLGGSRYELNDSRKVILPVSGGRQALDTHIDNELADPSLDPAKEKTLWLPVDDLVLATMSHLSDGGSLAGDRTLASVHPDYLQELFGERLGIETGARRTALIANGNNPINVTSLFTAASLPAQDGEVKDLRPTGYSPAKSPVKPGPGQQLLIIRINISSGASDDEDTLFRFSTGSIHLVGTGSDGKFKDFYPIGTLYNSSLLLLDKPDDFLFVKTGDSVDAVFTVDQSVLPGGRCAQGTLLSVKRFGLQDLSGQPVKQTITVDPGAKLIRMPILAELLKLPPPVVSAPAPKVEENTQTTASPAVQSTANSTPPIAPTPPPVSVDNTAQPAVGKPISDTLSASASTSFLAPGSISIGTSVADQEAKDAPVAGGKISLTGGQISSATIDPSASLTKLADGTSGYNQFFAPQERTMVQVQVHPNTAGWDWVSDYKSIALLDSNGNKYPASGVYALVKSTDGRGLLLRYDAAHAVTVTSPSQAADGDLYFIFLIPHDTDIKSFTMTGKSQDLDAVLKVQ